MRSRDTSFLSVGSRDASFIEETIGAGGPPTFDPATLPLTLWGRDYAGAPWIGSPSAGPSGGRSLASVGTDPSVGALSGHGVAVLDGVDDQLSEAITWDNLVNASAATVVGLIKPAAAAAHANWYTDPGVIVTMPFQVFGVSFSDAGIQIGSYDGATFDELDIPMAVGGYHAFAFTHDGAQFRGRVDSGAFSTRAKGATASLPAETAAPVGIAAFGGAMFAGEIVELMVADTVLSDADLDNIKSYFNARYGLSL